MDLRLAKLDDWNAFFERKTRNMPVLTKTAFITLTLAGLAVPIGVWAAPAIAARLGAMGWLGAASTGTAIQPLSGAALSSASLAYLGGGTIAAGGGGMVVGIGVIGVAGAALGGRVGALVAYDYFREIRDYAIRPMEFSGAALGHGHGAWPGAGSVIVINGFLQQDDESFEDWEQIASHFPGHALYGVTWESGTLKQLGRVLSGEVALSTLSVMLSARVSLRKLAWLAKLPQLVRKMLSNPWHLAFGKAQKVGVLNAEMLCRYHGRIPTLMGHSLGARTILYTLLQLVEKPGRRRMVADVFLFGGAADADTDRWERAAKAVSGTIYNFHSSRDQVLRKLYGVANPWCATPIGSKPIATSMPNIVNIDCSDAVHGHEDYKRNLKVLLARAFS